MVLVFGGISNAGLNDGLVAYYPFNGNAVNEVATGFDGVVNGATLTDDRHGDPNSAYYFDGNDAITVPDGNPLLGVNDGPFSIAAWMKIGTTSGTVVGLGNDRQGTLSNEEQVLVGISGGQLSVSVTDSIDENTWNYSYKADVPFNEWVHVVMVVQNDRYDAYINGVYSGGNPGPYNLTSDQWNYLNIGAYQYDSALRTYFTGGIDDVRIYNRALSEAEIHELYITDTDNDGIPDSDDNCPDAYNPGQADFESDGIGDICDPDDDNDAILDTIDNCQFIANPDQEDNDEDNIGDVCDDDDDNDSVLDVNDNCQFTPNPLQNDTDGDGSGDACDNDDDSDGVLDIDDNCQYNPNPLQEDNDRDGEGDVCDPDDDNDGIDDVNDNCPLTSNPAQSDLDDDNIGDFCDADIDGDGIANEDDNCVVVANVGQDDTDEDGDGDACDEDDDNDGVLDGDDNCELMFNPDQADSDQDGQGDVCDGDLDGDGVDNTTDNCPSVPNSNQNDWDSDGLGDVCDADIDGDGVLNESDECEFTPVGIIVDPSNGCSIEQLAPCEGPRGTTEDWKNHGKYVSSVAHATNSFVEQGLITEAEKDIIMSEAATSDCGL